MEKLGLGIELYVVFFFFLEDYLDELFFLGMDLGIMLEMDIFFGGVLRFGLLKEGGGD